jgi:energy-coupling factor transporter ATP-binding protein EcfA2
MLLRKFRVENFRSVLDSDWIEAEVVTALIGVNESGKTNLLLPLWKLRPAREGDIVIREDAPITMFADIRSRPGDYRFITAEFEDAELGKQIGELIGGDPTALSVFQVQRHFDGTYRIAFPKFASQPPYPTAQIVSELEASKRSIQELDELKKEDGLKDRMQQALGIEIDSLKTRENQTKLFLSSTRGKLAKVIPDEPALTSTLVPKLRQLIDSLDEKIERFNAPRPEDVEGVLDKVVGALPKFVYYSSYGNLDSEIYLPHVVQNLKREDLSGRDAAVARTLRVLFKFVQLSPEEILAMGQEVAEGKGATPDAVKKVSESKDERFILLQSAETKLTREFRQWWNQGDYLFQFLADGNHFRIWVSDDLRPEKVRLENRSTGLQWFLSFFLVLLVESSGSHKNTILLLDEPGHSLHPLAQRLLSAFFDNLSKSNQILYSTHSPFLIDADRLERARKVYIAGDGSTKATANLRYEEGRRGVGKDRNLGAAYAVHSALNLSISEGMLIGCEPIIVEGRGDQIYLTAIKSLLIGAGDVAPKRELVFPPGGGTKTSRTVASVLTGRDDRLPLMLLDGDAMGLKMQVELKTSLYVEKKEAILNMDDFVGFTGAEGEDLFPPDLLADVIDRWLRPESDFVDALVTGKPIVPQIEAWAKQNNVSLEEGWKVELAKRVKARALEKGIDAIPIPYRANWKKLFETFNSKA